MYLKSLSIIGYKNFDANEFVINLNKGLSVFVGENGAGKSAVIDAIRHLLIEDEFVRTGISEKDFHKPFVASEKASDVIKLSAKFGDLAKEEITAFLPWIESNNEAKLTLQVENKITAQGRYKRTVFGGVSKNSIFEWELLDTIHCVYLPPLRDAEAKLREGKGSRLARLLKNLNKHELQKAKDNNSLHPLEEKVSNFNKDLTSDITISDTNELIRTSLKNAVGDVFSQDTIIQFSEMNFNNIVENLKLLFFPEPNALDKAELFRDLDQNSLGYNNLLYLATVLAEFSYKSVEQEYLKLLLIEEPEAHLHPQLQIRLLKYLEKKANETGIQVILTTHSPVLSAAVSLDSIIHLSKTDTKIVSVPIKDCGLSEKSTSFLSRWLDATKATLFFARGLLLVEGIAEAMLLPEIAKIVIKKYNDKADEKSRIPIRLEELGISVINMNGIYFKYFMQLFCNLDEEEFLYIPVRCAGITDNDPPKDSKPTLNNLVAGKNPSLGLIGKLEKTNNCRLFAGKLKTLEYDLAMEKGNLNLMISAFLEMLETDGQIRRDFEKYQTTNWQEKEDDTKKDVASELLDRVEENKGQFAQILATKLAKEDTTFSIPEYIEKAVLWVCKKEVEV